MAIQNLQQLIAARERQQGGKMTDIKEPVTNKNDEVVEIMKLLFEYLRQSVAQINQDIGIIKQQQQEILEKLEDKPNEE